MSRLLKLIAIPAVILGASLFVSPKSAEAHGWGYGYGYSYYRPYTYNYYTPIYSSYYYPSYYHCW
jgi:hypothetical protein